MLGIMVVKMLIDKVLVFKFEEVVNNLFDKVGQLSVVMWVVVFFNVNVMVVVSNVGQILMVNWVSILVVFVVVLVQIQLQFQVSGDYFYFGVYYIVNLVYFGVVLILDSVVEVKVQGMFISEDQKVNFNLF